MLKAGLFEWQTEVSPVGWMHCPGPSQLGLQIAVQVTSQRYLYLDVGASPIQ